MKDKLQSRRATIHGQVSVSDLVIIGEAFKECNRRQDILKSIDKAGLNRFRRQIHFDDPVLQRNDHMLARKKLAIVGGFFAGLHVFQHRHQFKVARNQDQMSLANNNFILIFKSIHINQSAACEGTGIA